MTSISRGGDYRERAPISIGEPEKVTSWPFKEPDKTSAWDNEPAGEGTKMVHPLFIDSEKVKAEKRSALIRARMSPPGALNLPPLLEAQRLKYGITDGFFKSQACFDRIYVFPIDQFDDADTIAPGSNIQRPHLTKMKDMQEGHRGVLISAGLTAADRLMSHGIELGHIVTTNKNVPFARRCERLEDFGELFYLVMRDGDLAGSEGLAAELQAGKKKIIDGGDPGQYEHQVAVNDNGEWTFKKKVSAYINDTW